MQPKPMLSSIPFTFHTHTHTYCLLCFFMVFFRVHLYIEVMWICSIELSSAIYTQYTQHPIATAHNIQRDREWVTECRNGIKTSKRVDCLLADNVNWYDGWVTAEHWSLLQFVFCLTPVFIISSLTRRAEQSICCMRIDFSPIGFSFHFSCCFSELLLNWRVTKSMCFPRLIAAHANISQVYGA